jgi:hypothetical protein
MSSDLLEHAKRSVEGIAADFDKPDSDFLPTLLVKTHNDKVVVVGLTGEMSQAGKDEMANYMLAVCACARAKEVAFVSSAWTVTYDKPEGEDELYFRKLEQSEDFVMPRDHPDRVEVVNIMFSQPSGDLMLTSEITRQAFGPPTIGEWKEMGGEGTTLEGRFGNAIHDGIDLGQKMAADGAASTVVAYMDEMIAKGKFEELVKRFLGVMNTLNAQHRGN